MSEWQRIGSAPRDGTKIDVWSVTTYPDGAEPFVYRYTDVQWLQTGEGEGWCYYADDWGMTLVESDGPAKTVVTHWVPIPARPID